VLCVDVGTPLANRYLVIGYITVGTKFTQPLAGNERLRRLCYSGFVGRNVDNVFCMNYVSYFSYHKPILSITNKQGPHLTDAPTN
jgi:hypothetical protein